MELGVRGKSNDRPDQRRGVPRLDRLDQRPPSGVSDQSRRRGQRRDAGALLVSGGTNRRSARNGEVERRFFEANGEGSIDRISGDQGFFAPKFAPDAAVVPLLVDPGCNWATSCGQNGIVTKIDFAATRCTNSLGHNSVLLEKLSDPADALFYVQKSIENNWSRAVLRHQIESGLHRREGKAIDNFEATLPKPESDLARQLLRDSYYFDFLTLTERHNERELEDGLIDHLKLHCYVVIELKVDKFKPEYAGKLNFYISAVDSQVRTDADGPTLRILICKSKSDIKVEYSLRDLTKPIGVSEYQITEHLPDDLRSSLPTIEQIEAELGDADERQTSR